MTGIPLSETLRGKIKASPLLQKKSGALELIRSKLTSLLDDAETASALENLCEAEAQTAAVVAGLIEHSPFLLRIMRRHPDWLIEALDRSPDRGLEEILASILPVARRSETLEEAMMHLRAVRKRMALHIALADVSGVWSVEEVVRALSRFADAAVDCALRIALREAERSGRLLFEGAFEAPAKSGIVILAMGKHGAHELNYSSDIDLIVIFDPEAVPVSDGKEPLDIVVRIIKDMVKILHEQTGDGYVFRTDLRLRPDPASTPIAVPVRRAITYYQTVGQNWERAAMIKARSIAGDLALGESFLEELTPFVWRRYFDYAAIADIHAMKRQIHAHKGGDVIAIEGHDVKLGRGGIREIEFFVQTQQLVFGGKKSVLRGKQTLRMLELLCENGWITEQAVSELQEAYRFLRMVEHRLQMVEDQQTQRLPNSKEGVDMIALFSGFSPADFRKNLLMHFQNVEKHYGNLFEDSPTLSGGKGNLVFTGSTDDPETLKTLKAMGFQRPEVIAETVRGWHFGRRAAIVTPRAREVLTELVPVLLEAFGKSSDPDGAMIALDNALQGMPAVVELFTILKQNSALRGLFAEILGNAPRLAEVVVQRPHVLDALVDSEFANPATESVLANRFYAQLARVPEMEDFLDLSRDLVRAERFTIGARLFSGLADPLEAGASYAAIAAATINVCLKRVEAELASKHGVVPGARVAVVALGKLGGREMTALSDLDLMLLYDLEDGVNESNGARPLYASEWFSRLTQRLVTALTVSTKRGTLYDVDLRLRPSGGKGPVAVTLNAFKEYHVAESETWERMALTRARVVAGDPDFGKEIKVAIQATFLRDKNRKSLVKDIRAMRQLVATEKPAKHHWDLKLTDGGLVDIEFTTQFLLMKYAGDRPEILHPNIGKALNQLAQAGALSLDEARRLTEAWRLQTSLAQIIALGNSVPLDVDRVRKPFKLRLAKAAELPDFVTLEASLRSYQEQAHALMQQILKD
jgi:[glutamine synthetase] adenylyltransferase / [glutamine synthetase]-adenylyl-L-tyrosine phosphorylase